MVKSRGLNYLSVNNSPAACPGAEALPAVSSASLGCLDQPKTLEA